MYIIILNIYINICSLIHIEICLNKYIGSTRQCVDSVGSCSVCSGVRYEAASLLLVYGVYIMVLCFDLRISDFVLRKLSPCCTCLGSGSGKNIENQPLIGWNDDTSRTIRGRSRTDSGIFQDDSGYSHLSLSLHGLNDMSEGETGP